MLVRTLTHKCNGMFGVRNYAYWFVLNNRMHTEFRELNQQLQFKKTHTHSHRYRIHLFDLLLFRFIFLCEYLIQIHFYIISHNTYDSCNMFIVVHMTRKTRYLKFPFFSKIHMNPYIKLFHLCTVDLYQKRQKGIYKKW